MVKTCKHLWGGLYGHHCDICNRRPYLVFAGDGSHVGDCGWKDVCEYYDPEEVCPLIIEGLDEEVR